MTECLPSIGEVWARTSAQKKGSCFKIVPGREEGRKERREEGRERGKGGGEVGREEGRETLGLSF